ncbi:hypothetical protein [uncultured Methylovirgula sp.]|uniref:hypothetical protein n=1 Tax=uncultured Methylovirgula sp. TaxID=1285960 RepID=UPI00262C2E88|nr:hypothetical protein [uncultured Methylovirgula sp.]
MPLGTSPLGTLPLGADGVGPAQFGLTGTPGSFSLTGSTSQTSTGHKAPEATGSFALTGSASTLRIGHGLSGATGSFALTGSQANLDAPARHLDGATGQINLTGSSAKFIVTQRAITPVAIMLAAAIEGNAPCIGTYTVPISDIFDLGYEGVIAIGISMKVTATAQP